MSVVWDDNTAEFYDTVKKAANDGLQASTLYLATKMAKSMQRGAMQADTGGWKTPRLLPSAPGSPPNQQTGGLARSIAKVKDLVWAAGTLDGLALTADGQYNYGELLEFGTTKIAARPWLRPALETGFDRATVEFHKAFKRTFKKAGYK